MIVLDRAAIEPLCAWGQIKDALRAAFIAYSQGRVMVPESAHLRLTDPVADCHVRTGCMLGGPAYVVKVSNGFYDNPAQGLPSSDGLMALFCTRTGRPLTILHDRGYLTDLRTALTGALMTQLLARPDAKRVGVVGAGVQAGLQLEATLAAMPGLRAAVWGRSAARAGELVQRLTRQGLAVELVESLERLCSGSDILITTTPSRQPLVRAQWIRPGTHITAVGADAPGKQELEVGVAAAADGIVADTLAGCLAGGEIAHAVRAGVLDTNCVMELGQVLAAPSAWARRPQDVTLADLTGSALQDIAIATTVWNNFLARKSP